MTNVLAAMLKINPGIVFGGGVGVDGKEEARNTVWPVSPPALPPLLYLPPAFWSSQSLRGLCRSPSSPGQEGPLIIPRRKRVDATPGLLDGSLRT